MPRPKIEQLAWPEQAVADVVAADLSGEATVAVLAELEAGRVVALANLKKPIDPAMHGKYEVVADAFSRAQAVVTKLWRQAHAGQDFPLGFRPYIHSPDAKGVSIQRS
jgi:hypothetical protein